MALDGVVDPVAVAVAPGRRPVRGGHPRRRLVGARFDPQTPLRSARRAERRLGNAVLLTHDGYGPLSRRDPSTCVVQATGSYLVDLSVPARGTSCPSDHLPFDPDFGQPVPPTP
jgi:TAP-like protein